jgi:hypothetical protein
LAEFRVDARAVAKASLESSKDELMRSIGRMALDTSRKMNSERPNRWQVTMELVAVLIRVVVGDLAFRAGERAGYVLIST